MVAPDMFYKHWTDSCLPIESKLYETWQDRKAFSIQVLKGTASIIQNICDRFNLNYATEYYSLDVVFYDDPDVADKCPASQVYLRKIQIAFEHENDHKKCYQEVSHLTITNCDLRVLVTYPEDLEDEELLKEYKEIILYDPNNVNQKFLIILGSRDNGKILWTGYSLINTNWVKL